MERIKSLFCSCDHKCRRESYQCRNPISIAICIWSTVTFQNRTLLKKWKGKKRRSSTKIARVSVKRAIYFRKQNGIESNHFNQNPITFCSGLVLTTAPGSFQSSKDLFSDGDGKLKFLFAPVRFILSTWVLILFLFKDWRIPPFYETFKNSTTFGCCVHLLPLRFRLQTSNVKCASVGAMPNCITSSLLGLTILTRL